MKFFCIIGFHQWETIRKVPCIDSMASVFKNRETDTNILFQRCRYCPDVRAVVSDGIRERRVQIGMAARSVIQNIPRHAQDHFLKKMSTL